MQATPQTIQQLIQRFNQGHLAEAEQQAKALIAHNHVNLFCIMY